MNLFYDAKRRKVRLWVYVAFILVPILLIAIGIISGQRLVEKDKNAVKDAAQKKDIFD